MKIRSSVQFKAAFLTMVFLMNTMVGFACIVGMNMGFNGDHHKEHMTILASEHTHMNVKAESDHHSAKGSKDNCCKDEVAKLTIAEKMAQRSFDYSLLTLSFFDLPVTTYHIGRLNTFPVNTPNAYFVRYCRPPVPDVRIAIQSFQI
ncbi:hypothetical protein AAKU52_003513 [Pedobacter sp. CG_S7]|uniref:HYC_CC_PP family protein n=1 Tax=Pedobacter sp. CG_S7 TaxID=3143930 RepID=UPI003391D8A8